MLIENTGQHQSCPLCGCGRLINIGYVDYGKPTMFSTFEVELAKVPYVVRCDECSSWITQNYIPDQLTQHLYTDGDSSSKWFSASSFDKQKTTTILSRINKYLVAGTKVLDIGSNTGGLLDYAAKRGCVTFAVEPSASSRRVLEENGHKVYSHINDVVGEFNVITAFDVVEHLYDVNAFLRQSSLLLEKSGVLLILTGDVNSRGARYAQNNWWYVSAPEHVIFPSRDFFRLLEDFQVSAIDSTLVSVGYNRPLWKIVGALLWLGLIRRSYKGLPPPGCDHMLVTLELRYDLS